MENPMILPMMLMLMLIINVDVENNHHTHATSLVVAQALPLNFNMHICAFFAHARPQIGADSVHKPTNMGASLHLTPRTAPFPFFSKDTRMRAKSSLPPQSPL